MGRRQRSPGGALMMKWTVSALPAVTLIVASSFAQAQSPDGYWKGDLTSGNRTVPMIIGLTQAEDGSWSGTFEMPQSGIREHPLQDVKIDGSKVSFVVPEIAGDPSFSGTFSADVTAMSGEFSQAGRTVRVSFARTEPPEPVQGDPLEGFRDPGAPGMGPAGEWRAVLESGPQRLRLVMTITKDEDELQASLLSLEQSDRPFEFDDIVVEEGNYYFGITQLGAAFDGRLNRDGSEFQGTWNQGGLALPLSFRRVKSDG
jgi:hypothetical protein